MIMSSDAHKYQQMRRELKRRVRVAQKNASGLQDKMKKHLGVTSLNASEIFEASCNGKFDVWNRWMVKHYFEYTADVAKYSSLLRRY